MKNLLRTMVFNAPDAGGGSPAPGADAAPAATPPASGAASPPPPSAGTPSAGDGTTPADGANPAPAAAPGADWYRPKDLPDHLLGKDQNETMDKLADALKGYRQRDAQNGVPDKVDAYNAFSADVPETVKPHLETLVKDPLYGRVAEKALALKVPVAAYQGMVQEFISVSSEMGLMEPIVDAAAERSALVPDAARHLPEAEQKAAVNRRMEENYSWLDAMVARGDKGGISKDEADFVKANLGDSARGHRFFEFVRGLTGGTGGGPAMGLPGGGSGNDPKQEISRRAALPENTWGHPNYSQQSYDQLQVDRRRVYGD
ncbi:hypothetical protein [Rhizobium sp. SGZ-381]|uniref:hypothetical protein n=1 Tax=Rhizobium sp. SGZ-381 TaxID=3342800 RepID=UPI00366E59B3